MSEYSRRTLAFSAIAIALGIGISLGIAVLPLNTANPSSSVTTQSTTLSSTISSISSVSSVITTGMTSSATSIPSSSTTGLSTVTGVTTSTGGTTTMGSTVTSIVSSTTVTVSSVSSVTSNANSTCGAACGSFSITSPMLSVGNGSSTLDLTLQTQGNVYIGSATVYVNNTVIGTPPASESQPPGNILLNIQPNESSTIVLVIPSSTFIFRLGSNYFVLVYGWVGNPGGAADTELRESTFVTAT